MSARAQDELRDLVEDYLDGLRFAPDLGDLADVLRYSLAGGGKRIRPVVCLAVGEAVGCEPEALLPAAAAIELVHTFSLVHDDLPGLDDDDVRRGRPSTHARFGVGVGVIAGDALLAEGFRLALEYPTPAVARELARATLGMIGGQHLDLVGGAADVLELSRLKTGRLFEAAVVCALEVAGVPERERAPWRGFAGELGLVFQLVDDLLDGDGFAAEHGGEEARRAAGEAAERALGHLDDTGSATAVLESVVTQLAARTA
ncbi:MAG: polyprenyl synthetase family protein [Thermoleophilia bacterium]|nr:polyprenyl synthetase family protein [Thermoleophilia bacterium]